MAKATINTEAVLGQVKAQHNNTKENKNFMLSSNTQSAGAFHPAANMKNNGNNDNEVIAKINTLTHLNKIAGFDTSNSGGYILRLIVDKGERARLLEEINICQSLIKECFEKGCIEEGLRLNGLLGHACAVFASANNANGSQVA